VTEPTEPNVGSAVVCLMVGLPGAGKTYRAKELEISASALRLTPDEWQIALFGDQNPPDKRDLVEGKLVRLGMRAAELGVNVWIAGTVDARSQVGYPNPPVPPEHPTWSQWASTPPTRTTGRGRQSFDARRFQS
jgi:hypothetical protein